MPLETSDETTPPLSSPGVLEQFLLTRDSPEDLNSQLSLCNDQSVPDYLVSAFVYLPYYRTSYVFISPSSHAASHISTETEESFNEGKVNTKQDETVSYSATSTGYFPYFRTYGEFLCEPLTFGLNAEGKKPDNDGKGECEGDIETTIPPSLDLEKRAFSSMTDKQPRVHHLLRDRTFGHCSSTISFSSGLPGLNQPFPSTGKRKKTIYASRENGLRALEECAGHLKKNSGISR
ncbi:hypothetical protein Q9966_004504 [Columba livia]|nr:hypothetical protein Q9966_004504 [Columba livia]